MDSDEIIKKIDILEVELEDAGGKWKELYDATFDRDYVYTIEAGAQDRNAHTLNFKRLSQEEILERLKAGATSDNFNDAFLRERVKYWETYLPIITETGEELERYKYLAENGMTPSSKKSLENLIAKVIEKVHTNINRHSDRIQKISLLKEYVLSPEEISKYDRFGLSDFGENNFLNFKRDLLIHNLNFYKGTFVAYNKGILCGQSENRELLYQEASKLHGTENLAVFKVLLKNVEPGKKIDFTEDAVGKF
jgi:hypothetical protein